MVREGSRCEDALVGNRELLIIREDLPATIESQARLTLCAYAAHATSDTDIEPTSLPLLCSPIRTSSDPMSSPPPPSTQTRAPLSQIQPTDGPEAASSDEDSTLQPRERARKKLRTKIVQGLGESSPCTGSQPATTTLTVSRFHPPSRLTSAAACTGKAAASMYWGERAFVAKIVLGEGKVLDGWPAHVPFGALTRIPGGLRTVLELLARWDAGTMRWRDATPAELRAARLDPRSVLPGTPVPPRRDVEAHKDARWVVGTLVMHVSAPGTIVPSPAVPSESESEFGSKKRRRRADSGGRAAKRRQVEESSPSQAWEPSSSPSQVPRLGQRADNNTVRVRRFRNPKPGVKTAQYIWEDDGAPGGSVPMDRDVGRVLEDGRAVML